MRRAEKLLNPSWIYFAVWFETGFDSENTSLRCCIRGSLEGSLGKLKKKKNCNSSLSYTNRVSGGQREKIEVLIELCFLPFGGDTELIIDKE